MQRSSTPAALTKPLPGRVLRPFVLVLGLALAAMLALSACSSDDEQQQAMQQQDQPQQEQVMQQQQDQQQQAMAMQQQDQPQQQQAMAMQQQQDQQQQAMAMQQQDQPQQQQAMQQQDQPQQQQAMSDEEKTPIVFSDLNWTSSEIQVRAAAFIVENGYGYPTELIAGDTTSLFQGLVNGDTNVTMEIWPSQQPWLDELEPGIIELLGDSLDTNWEGWVIPQYLKDENPGLVAVSDLPEYMELFVTADSRGRARFIDCVPGWACEQVNGNKVVAYGLEDVLELVKPGSGAALFEDLESTYNRGEPWLGYIWGPTKPTATLDLYRLEEPEWTEECWNSDQGCAYPDSDVRIAVNTVLLDAAPDIIDFLLAWDFSAAVQVQSEIWMSDNNATPDEAAIWYLANNVAVWSEYVPADVAARVEAALSEVS